MLRWMKAWLATALWGFLLLGALGLAEALSQWVRFDLLGDDPSPQGILRRFLPPLVLYGWCGFLLAGLLYWPAALVGRWRVRPRGFAFSLAVSGSVASLITLYIGYLLREHVVPSWWESRGGDVGVAFLTLVWLAVVRLAWLIARRLVRWLTQRKTATLIFPVLIVIVTTSLWPDWRAEGCQRRTAQLERSALPVAGREAAPHLILITIDTLRRDALSFINAAGPPTPNLDRLAGEGTAFTQVWGASPWTLPSMAAVMTGLAPRVLQLEQYRPLPEEVETLAEVAWRQGYRTAAFATNPYLTEWYGFDRGFAFFEHALIIETLIPAERSVLAREITRVMNDRFPQDSAEIVIAKAVTWLWQRGRGSPFFLWIHLMNPHLPYRWRDAPGLTDKTADAPGRAPRKEDVPNSGYFKGRAFRALRAVRRGEFVPDAQQKLAIRTLYDREVQFTDHVLGLFFAELERLQLFDRSLVVVLSDHGEEFFEHGGFEHGHSVMPEVAGIPWLIRWPGGRDAGTVIDAAVCQLDVLPTICEQMHWPRPAAATGASLTPLLRRSGADGTGGGSRPLCVENLLYGPQQEGSLVWPYYQVRGVAGEGGAWFDLSTDPEARSPLAAAPPDGAERVAAADSLRSVWDRQSRLFATAEPSGQRPVPEDIKRKLKALGY
jgi:arylsulfatase A-like enzyme